MASFYVDLTPENDAPRVSKPVVHILEDSALKCSLLECFDVSDPDGQIEEVKATLSSKRRIKRRKSDDEDDNNNNDDNNSSDASYWNVTENGIFTYKPPENYFTVSESDSDVFVLKICDDQNLCTTMDVRYDY